MQLKDEIKLARLEDLVEERDNSTSRALFSGPFGEDFLLVVDSDIFPEFRLGKSHFGTTSPVEQSKISQRSTGEARGLYPEGIIEAQNRTIGFQRLEFERLEKRFRELKKRLYEVDGVEGLVVDLAAMSLDPLPEGITPRWAYNSPPPWHSTRLYMTAVDNGWFHSKVEGGGGTPKPVMIRTQRRNQIADAVSFLNWIGHLAFPNAELITKVGSFLAVVDRWALYGGWLECNKAGDQKQPRSKQKYRRKELWDGKKPAEIVAMLTSPLAPSKVRAPSLALLACRLGQVGGGVPDPLGESVEANRLLKEVVTQALIEEQGLAPGTVRVTIGMAALIRDAEEILSGDSSSLIDRGESLRPCLFRALWALLSFVRLNVTRGVDDSEGNLHKIHDELENIGVGIFFLIVLFDTIMGFFLLIPFASI
ncbi:hypothetical protein BKA70DRAFT_1238057 [Coprinopsis sp. MPI-PUGE-AT-0042]|nr:hypothetical protein BKA70DRAFT_1238057 [Coprinopsis sp. MPI-PUGE-AT-0042]